ncbi:MAG: efflux RND transporter permease subunit [Nibricoccus sp.]
MGTTIKGRETLAVRSAAGGSGSLEDIEKLGELALPMPSGAVIQLRQVADVRRVIGPGEIASENGRLRAFVQANVLARSGAGFVDDIKERISAKVTLEPGMTVEYWEDQHHIRRLAAVDEDFPGGDPDHFCGAGDHVFKNVAEAAHVLLAVPFALTGESTSPMVDGL